MKLSIRLNILLVFALVGCDKKSDYNNLLNYNGSKQSLNINNISKDGNHLDTPPVTIQKTDTVKVDQKFSAKIFLKNNSFKLVSAFLDCNTAKTMELDTVTKKIIDCKMQLYVNSDTLEIEFRPTRVGNKRFDGITLVCRDRENIFRVYPLGFEYVVTK